MAGFSADLASNCTASSLMCLGGNCSMADSLSGHTFYSDQIVEIYNGCNCTVFREETRNVSY